MVEAKSESKTEMVAPPVATTRLVEVEVRRPLEHGGKIYAPSDDPKKPVRLKMTESEADQLCAPFEGPYAFGGERSNFTADRHRIVRAVRVA